MLSVIRKELKMYVIDNNILTDNEFLMLTSIFGGYMKFLVDKLRLFRINYPYTYKYNSDYINYAQQYLFLSHLQDKMEFKAKYKEGGLI